MKKRLEEIAKEAGVSPSTIYHYIKKGILPKPEREPNRKEGRGVLAFYPEEVVGVILEIKERLTRTHSLEQVRKEVEKHYMPPEKIEKIITTCTQEITKLAKEGKRNGEEYKKIIELLSATTNTPLAIYVCTLDKLNEE